MHLFLQNDFILYPLNQINRSDLFFRIYEEEKNLGYEWLMTRTRHFFYHQFEHKWVKRSKIQIILFFYFPTSFGLTTFLKGHQFE